MVCLGLCCFLQAAVNSEFLFSLWLLKVQLHNSEKQNKVPVVLWLNYSEFGRVQAPNEAFASLHSQQTCTAALSQSCSLGPPPLPNCLLSQNLKEQNYYVQDLYYFANITSQQLQKLLGGEGHHKRRLHNTYFLRKVNLKSLLFISSVAMNQALSSLNP